MLNRRAAVLGGWLLASGSVGAAQEPNAPIGVQIGYSRADLGGPDGGRLASREGALAGVYLTGQVAPRVAIQPELFFALKGGRTVALLQGGGTAPLDIELAYLEMPVVAKLSIGPHQGKLHPVIFGGLAPAIRVGCDLELTLGGQPLRAACEDVEALQFQRFDWGAVAGGGVQWDFAETALGLEARYTAGFRSVFGGAADVRNRQIGILLALNF